MPPPCNLSANGRGAARASPLCLCTEAGRVCAGDRKPGPWAPRAYTEGGAEGAGPPIMTASDEEGERKGQLAALVVEKQEL